MRTVNSIADLRTQTSIPANELAYVLGYVTPGDGGGGEFYWDENSQETDNEGTVILPAPPPAEGRWKRLFTGNVKFDWFNPKKDGTENMVTKLTAALAVGNTELSPGTYLTGAITVPAGKSLIGAKGVELKAWGSDITLVTLSSGSRIENVSIDGNFAASRGIDVNNIRGVSISGIEIENVRGISSGIDAIGIHVRGGSTDIDIRNCYFHNIYAVQIARGILIVGETDRFLVDNCSFADIGGTSDTGGFADSDAVFVQTTKTDPDGPPAWSKANGVISNCTFQRVKKRAVKIQASGIVVENCVVKSEYAGEGQTSSYAGVDIFGSDCIVKNCYIELKRAHTGVRITSGDNNLVTGNQIRVDQDGKYTSAYGETVVSAVFISKAADHPNIPSHKNNITRNLYLAGSTHTIYASPLVDEVTIKDNKIIGNVSLAYTKDTVISDNYLINPAWATNKIGISVASADSQNTQRLTITNNVIKGFNKGMSLGSASSSIPAVANAWTILGNIFLGITLEKIEYSATTGHNSVKFINDIVAGDNAGPAFASGKDLDTVLPGEYGLYASVNNDHVPPRIFSQVTTANWHIRTQRMALRTANPNPVPEIKYQLAHSDKDNFIYYRVFNEVEWKPWTRLSANDESYPGVLVDTAGKDLNSIAYDEWGLYHSATLNFPTGVTGFMWIKTQKQYVDDSRIQFAYPYKGQTTGIWFRQYNGETGQKTWGAWRQIAVLDNAGRIPVARLGSGTPGASTYLRGDGTWAAIPAAANESLGTAPTLQADIQQFSASALEMIAGLQLKQFKQPGNDNSGTIDPAAEGDADTLLTHNGTALNVGDTLRVILKGIQELNDKLEQAPGK